MQVQPLVVASYLVAGVVELLVPVVLGSWPLAAVGACYVLPVSLLLGLEWGSSEDTDRRSALKVFIASWAAGVALWAFLIGSITLDEQSVGTPAALLGGIITGTLCFFEWHLLARILVATFPTTGP